MQGSFARRYAGQALTGVADGNADALQRLAASTVDYMGAPQLARLKAQAEFNKARAGAGGSSSSSGFDWGGAASGFAGALGGLFGGRSGGGSPNGGFGIADNLFGYKPSGIDFSSGWN